MTLLTIKNSKLYDVTFSALNKTYDNFLPRIQKAIGSIKLFNPTPSYGETNLAYRQKNNTGSNTNYNSSSKAGLNLKQTSDDEKRNYENSDIGIRLVPPYGWSKEETINKDNNTSVIFKSHSLTQEAKPLHIMRQPSPWPSQ